MSFGRDLGHLATEWWERHQENRRENRAQRRLREPHSLRVLIEGDSHMAFPSRTDPPEHLLKMEPSWGIYSLAWPGDELLSMASGPQKARLRRALRWFGPDVVVISGGGNDLMGGGLPELLSPQGVRADRLQLRLRQLRDALADLLHIIEDYAPEARVVLYGYDYPRLGLGGARFRRWTLSGPWVVPGMKSAGITDPDQQEAIARDILDRFHVDVLQRTVSEFYGVSALDLRGKIPTDLYADEIHPSSRGFMMVAHHLRQAIRLAVNGMAA